MATTVYVSHVSCVSVTISNIMSTISSVSNVDNGTLPTIRLSGTSEGLFEESLYVLLKTAYPRVFLSIVEAEV